MHILFVILQLILGVTLVVLLAVQTDKTEQGGGGVMGLGAAGGRMAGQIDMVVGAERILKPLSKWVAIGFLASSIINAIPADKLTFASVAVIVLLYLFIMLVGDRLWIAFTRAF